VAQERAVLLEGVDDFLAGSDKVFRAASRLNVLASQMCAATINVGPISMDKNGHTAELSGAPLELTRTEFDVLWHLLANRHRLVSPAELMRDVLSSRGSSRTAEQHVRNITVKLNQDCPTDTLIRRVRGRGYRIDPSWSPLQRTNESVPGTELVRWSRRRKT